MKNISNTENKENDEFVQNDLTVGNDVDVQNDLTVGNDVDVQNNLTVGNNATIVGTLTVPTINFGLNPFSYSQGSWTPEQSTIRVIGLGPASENVDWTGARDIFAAGSYVKLGSLVTVYYETSVTFDGTSNDSLLYRTPVIQNLPFRCKDNATPTDLAMSGVVEGNFPNGYAAGIPAPLAVTMDGGYTSTILEAGTTFTSRTPPFYNNPITWVTDGRTIFLSCAQSQYTLIGGLSWASLEGNVYNANVIFTGSNYKSEFKGSLTYFTDE